MNIQIGSKWQLKGIELNQGHNIIITGINSEFIFFKYTYQKFETDKSMHLLLNSFLQLFERVVDIEEELGKL